MEPAGIAEGLVADEEFVAADAGEGDFEAGAAGGFGDEPGVQAVDAGLVEGVDGCGQIGLDLVAAEFELVVGEGVGLG